MRITHNLTAKLQYHATTEKEASPSLLSRYKAYAEAQSPLKVYWLMLVILIIPCVLMAISIIVVAACTPNYLWFVALSMILFFGNLILHVAEVKSSVYVPLLHITVALFVVIPIVVYLVN